MEKESKAVKPEEKEVSATRRALIRAGWAVPVVLAMATKSSAAVPVSR